MFEFECVFSVFLLVCPRITANAVTLIVSTVANEELKIAYMGFELPIWVLYQCENTLFQLKHTKNAFQSLLSLFRSFSLHLIRILARFVMMKDLFM